MLGDKSYSGFDAMVLPEFAKKGRGEGMQQEQSFSGAPGSQKELENSRMKDGHRELSEKTEDCKKCLVCWMYQQCKGTGMCY